MTATRTRALPGRLLAVLALLAAGGAAAVYTTATRCENCKILRAEVEATGAFHVTLNSASSVHGEREHVDADYSRSFAEDLEVAPGEQITLYLTSALDIDRERRQRHECRIRENGKVVVSHPLTVRAGDSGDVASCVWTTVG